MLSCDSILLVSAVESSLFLSGAANQSHCPPPEQQQIRIGILGDMRQLERSARGRQSTP